MSEKDSGILADTSVWIEFFKQRSRTGDELEALIFENAVWTCSVVLFELVQGVKSEDDKSEIVSTLSHLKYAEMSKGLWHKAADLPALLRKKGLTIPLSDIFIAVIALENNLSLFTLDGNFKDLSGLKLSSTSSKNPNNFLCQNRGLQATDNVQSPPGFALSDRSMSFSNFRLRRDHTTKRSGDANSGRRPYNFLARNGLVP